MKTKARKITVNNEIYYWIVNGHNCDGDGAYNFKIWKDKFLLWDELYPVLHGK